MKTQIEISRNRRNEIKEIVLKTLRESGFNSLPVDIKSITKHFSNIRLIPYSVQMKTHNLTLDEVIDFAETRHSCVDLIIANGKKHYIIYYNDISRFIAKPYKRYRWNIAHELGHVLLEHNNEKTRFFRRGLTDSEYDILEAEADYFAQLILVPHAAMLEFPVTRNYIRVRCEISDGASWHRWNDYSRWKLFRDPKDEYDKEIYFHYFSFMYKQKCFTCNAALIQRYGKNCPICGEKTLKWGDGEMKYKEYETCEKGRLLECLRCDSEDLLGKHCHICAVPVENYCTFAIAYDYPHDDQCTYRDTLPSNARFCYSCGRESTFKESNLLIDWKTERDTLIEEERLEAEARRLPFSTEIDELPFN